MSFSAKETKEKWVDNETGKKVKPNTTNSTKIASQRQGGFNPSLPMYEQSSDSTITRATLTEGKITLNKDSNPTPSTAKDLGINTDLSQANAQTEAPKDINKALSEQQQIAQAMCKVRWKPTRKTDGHRRRKMWNA